MNRVLIVLVILVSTAGIALAQTGDLGAQIIAADAKLGASPGQIIVSSSGTISEGEVSLSVGHDLVCTNQATISLNAGSYLYQNSKTSIKNCIISSTPTPINGEVQSANTTNLRLEGVTFVGGGNLVYWDGVTDFVVSDNKITSITASDSATSMVQNGYYLINCHRGWINNLTVSSFVFPAGVLSVASIIEMGLSSYITINNVSINNVDASFAWGGSGVHIRGSSYIYVNGGTITHNAKMDGVTTESYRSSPVAIEGIPSFGIFITGVDFSYNGGQGLNTAAPLTLGDGIDIIETDHVLISNCTILGSGYAGNQQPGIWLFLDEDVVVENSDISDGSTAGVALAGSINVSLINNTISRNKNTGTFAEAQFGTATSSGATVTFVDGPTGSFSVAWRPGTLFALDGITYKIAAVLDHSHVVLATTPPDHPAPVTWLVNTYNEAIIGDVINDNGQEGRGGQYQLGIDWADGTSGIISGVTAIDTGAGTQLYGLELDNTASAILSGNTFIPNVVAGNGIYASEQVVSPASLSFSNQVIGTTSSRQAVKVIAGAVVLESLLIQVTGDFSETTTCGTRLPAYATCTIYLTFSPTVAGALTGTLTVTDEAPNSPKAILLAGNGVAAGELGLTIAQGGSNSATVPAGTTAKYSLSIGGAGTSGTASLTCTGTLPSHATCNLPASENISAGQPTAFTVSVMTPASTSAIDPINHRLSPLLCAFSFGWVFLPAVAGKKRTGPRYRLALLLLPLVLLCSCGGSGVASQSAGGGNAGGQNAGSQSNSYSLTVTASVGSQTQQVPLTLIIQ